MYNLNAEKATKENLENVWVLVARKGRTKETILTTYVGYGSAGSKQALDFMKEEKKVFVTLFPMIRLIQAANPGEEGFTGNNGKLWNGNLKALAKVGQDTNEAVETFFKDLVESVVGADRNDLLVDDEDWIDGTVFGWDPETKEFILTPYSPGYEAPTEEETAAE